MEPDYQKMFELWRERWKNAIAAAHARGIDAGDTRLEIGPPATEQQVREVELALSFPLPSQFRTTLLNFSGRVNYFWFLKRDDEPPDPLAGIFCGRCNWDISRLIEDYNHVRWLSENAYVENVPDEMLWKMKLPFHAIACGDFIAIDQVTGGVVYLGRELAGSHAHWLGNDFFDFMERWTALGCPDDDIWERFVSTKGGYIDLNHENTKQWCKWFGIPLRASV